MGVFPRGKSWYVKFRVDGKSIVKTAGKRTKAEAQVYEKELRKKHAKRAHGAAVDGLFTRVLAEADFECIHCHNTPHFSDTDFHTIGMAVDQDPDGPGQEVWE